MLRKARASQWAAVNTVLTSGDVGMEEETGLTKTGDGSTAWNSLPYSPLMDGNWGPQDSGWLAWTGDPLANFQASGLFNGAVSFSTVKIPCDMTITGISYQVYAAGSGGTTGQCFVGLAQGGALLGTSATQETNFASTGRKDAALTVQAAVKRGYAQILFLPNGGTAPQLSCAIANIASTPVAWPTVNGMPRGGYKTTGSQTSLPNPLGGVTAGSSPWGALY